MGNGVNVGAAYYVFRQYVLRHRDEVPANLIASIQSVRDASAGCFAGVH